MYLGGGVMSLYGIEDRDLMVAKAIPVMVLYIILQHHHPPTILLPPFCISITFLTIHMLSKIML